MEYRGTVIRPPSEASSFLLQATYGCPHGKCRFCGAYLDKRFGLRSVQELADDLKWASESLQGISRVFLCDGDSMRLPMKRLLPLLDDIRAALPSVRSVSTYARADSLRGKTDVELEALRGAGVRTLYMGLESGDPEVLRRMCKGENPEQIVEQGKRVLAFGFRLNVTVINGLGGVDGSQRHAELTAVAISEMNPTHASALSLMLVPGTPLYNDMRRGDFVLPDGQGMVRELRTMIAGLENFHGLFLADHASNFSPFRARMPRDREGILHMLDAVAAGLQPMKPDEHRRL